MCEFAYFSIRYRIKSSISFGSASSEFSLCSLVCVCVSVFVCVHVYFDVFVIKYRNCTES